MLSAAEEMWASLQAQLAKNLPAMQEPRVRSLGEEDPLEKGMATGSSIPTQRETRREGRRGWRPTGVETVHPGPPGLKTVKAAVWGWRPGPASREVPRPAAPW